MTERTMQRHDIPQWDLSDRLRKALRHADVSVQEMSQLLEVSRHTISNWVNGNTRPRSADVRVWAMRCGVPYEWLATGREDVLTSPSTLVTREYRANLTQTAEPFTPPSVAEIQSYVRRNVNPTASFHAAGGDRS